MNDDGWITETRTRHFYRAYGRVFEGYGSSMDGHRCGDPRQPCWKNTETRKVTEWADEDYSVLGPCTCPNNCEIHGKAQK